MYKQKIEIMKKKTNQSQDTPVADTFKGLLLMSIGVPVGNIRPYRLRLAPSCFGGFERMSVADARALGVDIPKTMKENDEVYIRQLGPVIFCEWMPVRIFEAAFEPVPEQKRGDRALKLTEEVNNHHVAGKALNERCYALSVQLLADHDGNLSSNEDDNEQTSTYLHVEDRDPVELIITKASLRDDGKIVIKGNSYYSGEEYEQECGVEAGMDILNFILSQQTDRAK